MTSSLQASSDQPIKHTGLEQLFIRLNALLFSLAVLMLILPAVRYERPLFPVLALAIWLASVLLWARRQVRRGRLARASALISISMLLAGLIGAWLVPAALPAILLMPVLAVVITLPYLDSRALCRLGIAAWIVTLAGCCLAASGSTQVSGVLIALLVGAPAVLMALIMLLVWHSHRHLVQQLERSEAANSTLLASRARLETEVLIRTAEAHEREAKYRAISELISDYVYVMRVDSTGAMTFEWHTEALANITGYTLEELKTNWIAIVYPDDRPIVQRGFTPTNAEQPDVREFRIITKGGDVRWLRDHIRPEWDAAHTRVTHILGAAQDITERKLAEEERLALERKMLEAQKLESLGVLAGGIAHDFNNFLMGVLGNAGLALRELPPGSETRESIEQIEGAARRAAELTRQMLAYTGRGHLIVQPIHLNILVEEMITLLNASITKTASLEYDLAPHLPAIEADSSQIRQVVMNLIINASEAIGDSPGRISVMTSMLYADQAYLAGTYLAPDLPAGPYVCLEVADTGCGMNAETLAKIFDPFYTTKFAGRGLGLAAVLGIVRGHKGALKVWSESGGGTTFTILFPCIATESEISGAEEYTFAPAPTPIAARPTEREGTVLVIDDEESVRTVTARMLQRFGYTALVAADGRMGVEVFRVHASSITCVMLDISMPYLNGEQVLLAIRRLNPDVRVLLMSGHDEQGSADRFAGQEIAGFLQKPFTSNDLLEKIGQVLV